MQKISEYPEPQAIVRELDRFIIGQDKAKKVIAIAVRNRWRRKMVNKPLRDEIIPKNVLIIGPTGVGKTEIVRRLAKLVDAPLIKVEATNFTEIGYVGKDVESIIKDLVDNAVKNQKKVEKDLISEKAKEAAKNKILDLMVSSLPDGSEERCAKKIEFSDAFDKGDLDDQEIEIDVFDLARPFIETIDMPDYVQGVGVINITDIIGKSFGSEKKKKKKIKVGDAFNIFWEEEADNLLDEDKIIKNAIKKVEEDGIVIIDEIDKVTIRDTSNTTKGVNVSREGVQRDLLPLIEGTIVNTRYGSVKTDHVLFIASGADRKSVV